MSEISALKDASFLRQLDTQNIKTYYVKILVLDKNDLPIRAIEGRTSGGSISINGSSSVRRAGSLTFLAEESENDLTDVDNLLSINKKIKILIGIENKIDLHYDNIIWFQQGIFIITQPSLQHGTSGVTISLQFKDKMCLLNGECAGNLPTSVTFHEYDQIIGLDDNAGRGYNSYPQNPNTYTVYLVRSEYLMWNPTTGWSISSLDMVGEIISVPQKIYDIIQTLVCNFGNESMSNIIINDIPQQLKASVRYVGSDTLFYNETSSFYTLNEDDTLENPGNWHPYNFNEDCGYVYTDFTYPGELISAIGDNICSVLDKIISVLGNYEYFYDIEGHFVFQEKKNNLNTSYDPVQKLNDQGFLLSSENYFVDFSNHSQSIYTFDEGSLLITTYSNSPNYASIKNDYHIWGKNEDGLAIHYHIVIKDKPVPTIPESEHEKPKYSTYFVVAEKDELGEYTGMIHIADINDDPSEVYEYIPTDWRAELYLQGYQKKMFQQRPDIYEQELLDLFDSIYDMRKQEFKVDIVNHPNDLKYWIDYINPALLFDISVDVIGTKMMSQQKDKIIKLYNEDIPDVIIINEGSSTLSQATTIAECESCGQPFSRVSESIYSKLAIGTVGYTAQETARELLYQFTEYNSSISITSIPIYYLDVNSRITVRDKASGIHGDYIINSINLPLDAKGTMTISASKALTRV